MEKKDAQSGAFGCKDDTKAEGNLLLLRGKQIFCCSYTALALFVA